MRHKIGPHALLYPTAVWVFILTLLFAAEYGVMIALPVLMPDDPTSLVAALIDALTITAVLAPAIWFALVRPLRGVIRLRTKFLGDLFAAIEDERRQTAHELHDGIGQELSLLISGLRSAHETLGNPEDAARCAKLQHLAQTALAEVKRVAQGLRPSLLNDLGLVAAMEKVVRDFNEHHRSVEISLQATMLEGMRLPDSVETAVFRVFQEAIANVMRHSAARHVRVALGCEAGHVTLAVGDDGRGFDPKNKREAASAGSHMGLTGIRERVALLGGRFSLDTSPGHGCRLTAVIPVGRAPS